MEKEKIDEMKQRWQKLWDGLDTITSGRIELSELVHLYNQPHREYHNLQHIYDSLKEMDEVYNSIRHPSEVEMAIWYHDAIYDTKRNDNEKRSAELSWNRLYKTGLLGYFINDVYSMILATKHNGNNIEDNDTKYLVDIDLSNLGVSPEKFEENSKKIRQEYGWVPESEFNKNRKAILEHFNNSDYIYHTNYFREKYENQARENLEREIKKLS